ncbi:hypothetical protein JAAARDRAFT_205557 [Jaapia argillacea MUCL 33604]|uniref:Histone H1 n=1 Tax=Jaapia argillacea MUCL 33604 TaxID=933084 RepID=A0A067Q7Q8_9AGAM|nr:hypothetical protein JAAARDRAFT_205557 [Jaapia argillacea MUCL 33604]
MSSTTSSSPVRETRTRVTQKKVVPATIKTVTKTKAATRSKESPSASHPSWKDIIKECIAYNHEEVRAGVSRSTIKKYAEDKYNLDMNSNANLYQLNRAITNGAEKGDFHLPKGPSGKVKLAPKTKKPESGPTKENTKPAPTKKSTETKKVAEPKKAAPAKKATKATEEKATKSTTKKPATTTKKPASTATKKPAAKATTTKKPTVTATKKKVTTKAAPTTKKTSSKKVEAKKAAAKTAATKPRSRRPTSKAAA